MAAFTITVYDDATNTSAGPPVQELGLAVTSPAQQSAAISGSDRRRRKVRLATQADCHFKIGTSPTATGDSAFLSAGGVEYTEMEAGWKVSVLAA